MVLLNRRGVTLVELLVAAVLVSVVFLGSTTVYVTALKFFNDIREKSPRLYGLLASEIIARKVTLANDAIVNDAGTANNAASADPDGTLFVTGKQIKLRWDYNSTTYANLATPANTADDSWIKYKLIENPGGSGVYRLYTRSDTSSTTDVTTSDTEVDSQLKLGSNSRFRLSSPSGNSEGSSTDVDIDLEVRSDDATPNITTVHTAAALGAKTKK